MILQEQIMVTTMLRVSLMIAAMAALLCSSVQAQDGCQSSFHRVSIPEDSTIGTHLLQLLAPTDAMIILNNTRTSFAILPNGTLVTAVVLDREQQADYTLTIVSQEEGLLVPLGVVWVTVSDVADTAPVFNQQEYQVSVPRNLTVGSVVATITATAMDLAPPSYSLIAAGATGLFAIGSHSGNITLLSLLPPRVGSPYRLVIVATSGTNGPSAEAVVILTVSHTNTRPSFSSPSLVLGVAATPTVGSVFGYVLATNHDDPNTPEGTISYSTPDNSPIGIMSTGAVFLKQSLASSLSTTVLASVAGNPALTASLLLNVTLSQQSTVFNQLEYAVSVSETTPPSSPLVTVGVAGDSDGVIYEILEGNTNEIISINSSNGELLAAQSLNHEGVAIYSLLVGARRSGHLATCLVTITVLDENEPPTFSRPAYKVTIPENSPLGSTVLVLTAHDQDAGQNGVISYSSQSLPSLFSLIPPSFIILDQPLDRESVAVFSFSVTASDGGTPPLSSEAMVIVTVGDVNDHTPQFIGPLSAEVTENLPRGTLVAQLNATDPDEYSNGAISFSLLGPPVALHYLVLSPRGELLTRRSIDREIIPLLLGEVEVRDNGRSPRSSRATIRVTVNDVGNTPPVFTRPSYSIGFSRPLTAGERVDTITAYSQSSTISYAITGSDLFSIDPSTGTLSAVSSLAMESIHQFNITATSSDTSASVPYTITISPSSPPYVRPHSVYLSAPSYLLPDHSLIAVDTDLTNPSSFSLDSSSLLERDLFSINATTGQITASNSVDSGRYNLNVSVDGVGGVGLGIVMVRVNLVATESLGNAVVVSLPLMPLELFLQRSVDQLLMVVRSSLSCSSSQVELFAIQSTAEGGTEVAIAVRTPDLVDFLPHITLLDQLLRSHAQIQQQLGTAVVLQPVDPCSSNPCSNYQLCSNTIQLGFSLRTTSTPHVTSLSTSFTPSFVCECPRGFLSTNGCIQLASHCDPDPCMFGGTCVELLGDYRCQCPSYTSGKNCSIVCPSSSCELCSPNPCRNGGLCSDTDGTVSCSCPPGHTGDRCELTSVHFSSPSYARLADLLEPTNRHTITLSVSTITPTGLLLYTGYSGQGGELLAVELVLGQVRVTSHTRGVMESAQTAAVRTLSDGQWHTITVIVTEQAISVTISDCSTSAVILINNNDQCTLSININSSSTRLVSGQYPVYVGGVPPSPATFPLLSSAFSGCVRDVMVDNVIVDFSAADMSGTITHGCPPREMSCDCGGGACDLVWNGYICADSSDPPAVTMDTGHVNITSGLPVQLLTTLSISVRTRSRYSLLAQLGQDAVLELIYGSVVYRQSSCNAPIIQADGQINDGLWHTITLSLTPTISLSLDNGRVNITLTNSLSNYTLTQLTIGSDHAPYSGCVRGVSINSQPINLIASDHMVTPDVISGCSSNQSCPTNPCPVDSTCTNDFGDLECTCNIRRRAEAGQCIDPCASMPCVHGDCRINTGILSKFICACTPPFLGLLCDQETQLCGAAHYTSSCSSSTTPFCRPCVCDHEGVVKNDVCDTTCGNCTCDSSLATYSPPGDLHCQLCGCDPNGSVSTHCGMEDGQCECRPNMAGRRCDRCNTDYAGFEDGCRAAVSVRGAFKMTAPNSDDSVCSSSLSSISDVLKSAMLLQLQRFGLPWKIVIDQLTVHDNGNVTYRVQAYSVSPSFALPSLHTLAAVMQTVVARGRIALYQVFNNTITESCSTNPCSPDANCTDSDGSVVCSCITGEQDGVLCRKELPQRCVGADIDKDGVPNSCDNCPYLFNPDQRDHECQAVDGSCPYDLSEGLLWPLTPGGEEVERPCPAPLSGVVRRQCNGSGTWLNTSLGMCLSPSGRQLNDTLAELSNTDMFFSSDALEHVATHLGSLTASSTTIADLLVAARLLKELLSPGLLDSLTPSLLQPLVSAVSNLTNPSLTQQWRQVANNMLLLTMEALVNRSTEAQQDDGELTLPSEHASMMVARQNQFNGVEWSVPNGGSVYLPAGLVSDSDAGEVRTSLLFLSSFSQSLPVTTPNTTATSPIWVITIKGGGVSPHHLTQPLSITFPRPDNQNGTAVCVFWNYTSIRWDLNGCQLVSPSTIQPVCRCNHLSSFTLLVMATNDQEDAPYAVSVFNNLILGFTSLLLLAALFMLCLRKKNRKSQFTVAGFQLVFALMILHVLFLVAQNFLLTLDIPCTVLAVTMQYLLLTALVWVLVLSFTLLLIVRTGDHPRLMLFKIFSSILAWVTPLAYTGVCVIVVQLTQPSLLTMYGTPRYCWAAPGLATYLAAPPLAIILLLVLVVMVASTALLYCKASSPNETSPKQRLKFFLLFLWAVVILFFSTWSLGWLAIAGSHWSQPVPEVLDHLFAGSNVLLIILIVVIMSFGDDILEYCQYKLHLTTSVEMELRTTATLREIKKTSSAMRESQGSLRHQPDTSRRSSSSSLPDHEPEYHDIPEHQVVTLRKYPNGEGESVEMASMESDSYKTEDDLRNVEPEEPVSEAGGQPWFVTSRTPSPQDRYSPDDDAMLDKLYQQGRGPAPPTSTPLHEDPLWYSGNQSFVSNNNGFTEAAPMSEGLYAEIHDNDTSLTPIPPPHRPHLQSHGLGARSASLSNRPVSPPDYRQRLQSAVDPRTGNVSPSLANGHASSSQVVRYPDGSQIAIVESLC